MNCDRHNANMSIANEKDGHKCVLTWCWIEWRQIMLGFRMCSGRNVRIHMQTIDFIYIRRRKLIKLYYDSLLSMLKILSSYVRRDRGSVNNVYPHFCVAHIYLFREDALRICVYVCEVCVWPIWIFDCFDLANILHHNQLDSCFIGIDIGHLL